MNTTPRPKSVALMFLVGAFLTGGAFSYAATKTFGNSSPAPALTPGEFRSEIKRKLELTPEQALKFDAHYDARRAVLDSLRALYEPRLDSIRALYQPVFDSVRAANQQNVMGDLNTLQKAKYTKMIEDDKKRADSTRKATGK